MRIRRLVGSLTERYRENKYPFFLALAFFVYIVLHLVLNGFMSLHVDEANWLMQTKHLQAGYFFHPPFIVYELFIVTKIFGTSLIGVRMGSLLFTMGSFTLVYNLSSEMFEEKKWAFIVTLFVMILPITNYWLGIAQQDPPFLFFYLLSLLFVWRAVNEERNLYWYLAGFSGGFLLLCKLQSVIFFICLLLFLITSKKNRFWLRKKEPWLGFGIVVLMFIPTFLWYISHKFEPITYQLSNRPGFLNKGLIDYIAFVVTHVAKEMLVLSPFVYLVSIFALFYGFYLAYFKKDENDWRFQLLFCMSAPGIIFFTITGGPPYWSVFAHVTLLIAASGLLPIFISRSTKQPVKRYLEPVLVSLVIVIALLTTAGTIWIAGGDQIQNDWKPLYKKVAEVRREMGGGDVYLLGSNYFVPSELSYYNKGEFKDYAIAFEVYEHVALGKGSGDYSPWVPLDKLKGKNFVFVDAELNPDEYRTPLSYWIKKLKPYFDRVDDPVVFKFTKWGKDVRKYYIFKAYGFKGHSPEMDKTGEVRDYVNRKSD